MHSRPLKYGIAFTLALFAFGIRCTRVSSVISVSAAMAQTRGTARVLPRTSDGKPDLQGIWRIHNTAAFDLQDHAASSGIPAGKSVVEGGTIPYLTAAAAKKKENFANRQKEDPLNSCFMPGVPRIMYLDYPFQIFQTPEHIAMTFEWSQVYRLVYTNGKKGRSGIDAWMGDSRGHWEGDTLVVEVKNNNDRTWFDMAGNFHSDAMTLVERYTMADPDTIQYEVTVQDPKTFSKPWKISMPINREKNMTRLLEYQCQAEKEEAKGDFEREPRTWYPGKK